MRVLIVGAGATGQVIGAALAAQSDKVAYLVRHSSADTLELCVTKLPMRSLGQFRSREWRSTCASYSSVSAVLSAGIAWDAVFLAVAAPALRGAWLPELLRGCQTAVIIFIAGGVADSERSHLIASGATEGRLLQLGFTAIAWQSPLPALHASLSAILASPTAAVPPAKISCVTPSPLLLAGPAIATELAKALHAGGVPCTAVRSVADLVFADCILLPLCAALGCVGWSFARLRANGELRTLAAATSRECIGVAQKTSAGPSLLWRFLVHFIRGHLLFLILLLAPLVLPFDFEAYLAHHFGAKHGVSGQIDLFLDAFDKESGDDALCLRELLRRRRVRRE